MIAFAVSPHFLGTVENLGLRQDSPTVAERSKLAPPSPSAGLSLELRKVKNVREAWRRERERVVLCPLPFPTIYSNIDGPIEALRSFSLFLDFVQHISPKSPNICTQIS